MSEELAEQNKRRMAAMAAEGLALDTTMLVKTRLDLITSVLVEKEIIDETDLNSRWEEFISKALDEAESEIARAKLLVALESPEAFIVDL